MELKQTFSGELWLQPRLWGWDAQVVMSIGLPLKGFERIQLPSQASLAYLLLAGSQVCAVETM